MTNKNHRARLWIVSLFFVGLYAALTYRMFDIMVLHRQFLQGQGNARSLRVVDIPAHRGMITDRQGAPLAISTPVHSVWVNPKELKLTAYQRDKLARLLDLSPKALQQKISAAHKRAFLYLKRQLTPARMQDIAALKIKGVFFQQEFKRYYPEAESTAQLLGFTNIDDRGIEGLELAYQSWLEGLPGKRRVLKDRTGNIIEDLGLTQAPRPGHDLVLSIDRRIQYLAYNELKQTVEHFHAKFGTVVVLDTQTGEILAAANAPSYNPNVRASYDKDAYRNKAFTDLFEPGSVIKPFSIASALESKTVTPETIIDTRPSWMIVHGHTIRDVHNYGVLDVTGVLQHSSNVGVTKMILQSPPEQLINLLRRAGFAQRTESGYPGESDGALVTAKQANPFVLATLGFGYGISTTAIQLAKAYTVFANHGILKPVTLIHNQPASTETRVLDAEISDQVLAMMEAVLGNEGTGRAARVPGYRVAGKTGTARIASGSGGYAANRHIGSFIGMAPVSKPRLTVVVVIHDPAKNGYYGAMVAAPLFARVMSGALRILDIPPDKTTA